MSLSPSRKLVRRVLPCVVLASLLVSVPSGSAAQDPEDGVRIYAGISGGGLWPDEMLYSWLGDVFEDTEGFFDVASVRLVSGPVAGLNLEARFPGLDLGAGVSLKRTFGTGGEVATTMLCAEVVCNLISFAPVRHSFDADVTLLSAHLDVRGLPSIWGVQPFVSGGAGVKFHDFETESVPESVIAPLPGDDRATTYRFGAGASLPLQEFEIAARVTDFLSDYTPPGGITTTTSAQHDLAVTLELLYRLR